MSELLAFIDNWLQYAIDLGLDTFFGVLALISGLAWGVLKLKNARKKPVKKEGE